LLAIIDTNLLIKRLNQHHPEIEIEKSKLIVSDYVRFLVLKKNDTNNPETLSPSSQIDLAWHLHILDTIRYSKDCIEFCGHLIQHNPDGGLDRIARNKRLDASHEAYKKSFKTNPANDIWEVSEILSNPETNRNQSSNQNQNIPLVNIERFTLSVVDMTGSEMIFKVSPTTTVVAIKRALLSKWGYPIDHQKLFYNETKLENHLTFGDYEIKKETTLYLVVDHSGC